MVLFHIDSIGQGGGQLSGLFPRATDALLGRSKHKVRTQGAQLLFVFVTHQLRHTDNDPVALQTTNIGQSRAGVAAAGLDDGPAVGQLARFLGIFDHVQGRPVFEAVGVKNLQLGQDLDVQASSQAAQPQHWRSADQLNDRIHDHAMSPSSSPESSCSCQSNIVTPCGTDWDLV